MRYFTSDTHFHDERLNLFGRDFLFSNSKEVDEYIIKRWNEKVKPEDLVYHLGDVSVTKEGYKILNQLNGIKILISGNYDLKYDRNFLEQYFVEVLNYNIIEIKGNPYYLNHYPEKCQCNEMFNIVGHVHALWQVQRKMINVSSDAWHFSLLSENDIIVYRNKIELLDINVFAGELTVNSNFKNTKL